jgi:paraquat-inducible protein B
MNDAPHDANQSEPPQARFRPSRWPGWIWAIPIAALGIVGWLGLRDLLLQGPEVTVRFGNGSGIQEGNTKVKYQGMIVGQVDSISLDKDLQHVAVKLQLHSDMEGHLGPRTRYWISGQTISLSNLASIKSALSGPDIWVDPRPGKTQDKVDGLTKPPILKDKQPGREFVLETGQIGNVSPNTPVYFHEQEVGEVLSYDFEPSKRQFRITAFVHARPMQI